MKESVPTKKVQSDRQRKTNPLSGNILLCTSICCSVMADSLDGDREEKEENHHAVFPRFPRMKENLRHIFVLLCDVFVIYLKLICK